MKLKKLKNLKMEEIVDIRSRMSNLNLINSTSDLYNVNKQLSIKVEDDYYVSRNYLANETDAVRICNVMHIVNVVDSQYIDLLALEASPLVSYEKMFKNFGRNRATVFNNLGFLDISGKGAIMGISDIENMIRAEIHQSEIALKNFFIEDPIYEIGLLKPMPDITEHVVRRMSFCKNHDVSYIQFDMQDIIEEDSDIFFETLMELAKVAKLEKDKYTLAKIMGEYLDTRIKLRFLIKLLASTNLDMTMWYDDSMEEVRFSNDVSEILSLKTANEADPITILYNMLEAFNDSYGEMLDSGGALINGANLVNSLRHIVDYTLDDEKRDPKLQGAIELFSEKADSYTTRSSTGEQVNTFEMIKIYVDNLIN